MAWREIDVLAKLWRLAAFKETLYEEPAVKIDTLAAVEALKTATDLPLEVRGELVHALTKLLDLNAENALHEAQLTNRDLYNSFREQISVNEGSEVDLEDGYEVPLDAGTELGEFNLPESLTGRRNQTALPDYSIDAVVREDQSMDVTNLGLPTAEALERSPEELEALESLDLGDLGGDDANENSFELPTLPESDMGLEFGSDLQGSSSPPRTPQADHEPYVRIQEGSSPQAPQIEAPKKRATRRHGAPVDDIISIARPTRPSAQILRGVNSLAESIPVEAATQQPTFFPLDAATERLLDPEYIQAEMKRRRMAETGDVAVATTTAETGESPEGQSDPLGEVGSELDLEMDWDMNLNEDAGSEEDSRPSPVASDSDEIPSSNEQDDEDSEETLLRGATATKAILHSHLKKKGTVIAFDEIATMAPTRADMLLEVLALAGKGRIVPTQDHAWGPLTITQV